MNSVKSGDGGVNQVSGVFWVEGFAPYKIGAFLVEKAVLGTILPGMC
ncbi:hypothetical protein [Candidatus Leptofilum sp.]